ncbi:peptidoglycan-binding domain-containing protein [Streptomyces sp. G1]|uniref:peptidoglycan-binding domain-containing protein n=1 Tax=Streptomyces sp. G1 TaxID=361572 RepID=UPI00202F5818|nr:peptidoglycan-binding domain-containing protein [Streptomyces sp. G1]MCM1976634.1 peptidoglycan-binding protein [Streptomyces sp. G1]
MDRTSDMTDLERTEPEPVPEPTEQEPSESERTAEAVAEGTAAPAAGAGRGRTVLVAGAVALVAAVAVVGALGLGGGADDPGAPARSGSLVQVTKENLVERTQVEGQLGYGAEIPLPVKATGTVTWLPEPGTTVERGGDLLRVDDRPVVLLYGALPMFRELGLGQEAPPPTPPTPTATPGSGRGGDGSGGSTASSGGPGKGGGTGTGASTGTGTGTGTGTATGTASASGAPTRPLRGMDVMQFERNLAALGYTGFTVDEEFTTGTATAVKRWQKSLGLPQTGRVGIGDVIYSTGQVRIGHAAVRLGSAVGENALTHTGTARKVVVNASAQEASWAVRGTAVTVTLPDGREAPGEVASVGASATAGPDNGGGGGGEGGGQGGGSDAARATVPVTVVIADQEALGRLESGPVGVSYVGKERRGVLAVPVAALVALAEGGHGLETTDGTFVAVQTGLFADGKVEVSGPAVREGLKARVPE